MLEKYKSSQPIAYKIVTNVLTENRFVHAYLIETNGYENGFSFALDFAKLLLCPNYGNGQSVCDGSIQYQSIDENNFPELKIINPDGSWIKKEQLLNLQNEFNKKSIIGNRKVYIINKAERLNINSSNTILKFLEEPQEGIIAILVTNNIYQLIDTIISRCQIISLNGQSEITEEKSTVDKIAKVLTDNENDYKLLLDNNLLEKIETVVKFVKYYENNGKKILLYISEYWFNIFKDKEQIYRAILLVLFLYKDILNYKINNKIELFDDYVEDLKIISQNNTVIQLIKKISIINENRQYIDNNANLNLLMDKIIIELEEGVL